MTIQLGPRLMQKLAAYAPSAGTFGATGFVLMCYYTDWRVIMDYVPFYNTKFPPPEKEE